MSGGIKMRLAAFILVIAGMTALILWTARSAWRRGAELREKLTAVQLQSFQIADHFQQTILELNNLVLRYGVYHDTNDWARFQVVSQELDQWIDSEHPILASDKERRILDGINTNYDGYLQAARQIHDWVQASASLTTPLVQFAAFERQSQRILHLGFQLAGAHRESMDAFLADSNQAINYLTVVLAASLGLLLVGVGGLAVVVYRELIAPLRIRLVESQALLERQEKLASLGLLAAGVAHEIRNPLTAIKAWLFIQEKHLQPGSAEHADARIIGNEIDRLERIVRDVLLLARPSEPQFKTVPAADPLRAVQILLAPQLDKMRIRLVVEDSVAAHVRIDSPQIQQVLINLIHNAAESIGQDGTVTLRVRLDARRLAERLTDVAILEVADTGKGMPPDIEKRLFDPFFTTKESGTGLGLSIASRIVEKHGGALQYKTKVDRGTTFGIVLPRVEREA